MSALVTFFTALFAGIGGLATQAVTILAVVFLGLLIVCGIVGIVLGTWLLFKTIRFIRKMAKGVQPA